jgi:hypothetical protein
MAETPDPVATYLADVRMQAEDHHLVPGADALALVAAVEAVLKLAGEWDQSAAQLDEMAVRAAARGAAEFRTEVLAATAQRLRDCAVAHREAISRELLGGEEG